MDILFPLLLVGGLFWLLREMEGWLHRHIFKVGWLITKSYDATTIFYYTFFLPGVFLNQVTVWLAAGMLNVRAESALKYPEKQEIGELKLDFVRLAKKVPMFKLGLIHFAPLLVGLVVIGLIARHVFDMGAILDVINSDPENGLGAGIQMLLSTPDFWLWTYLIFAVSNTMMPERLFASGWGRVMWIVAGVSVLLILVGLGDNVEAVAADTVTNVVNGLSLLFGLIIVVDIIFTAALAIIENTIEYITGDSATFKNGKMIAISREELIAQRQKERQAAQKKREQQRKEKALPAGGPPSIYALELPVPGAPGSMPERLILEHMPAPELDKPAREEPKVIEGTAERRTPAFNPGRSANTDDDVKENREVAEPVRSEPPKPASPFGSRPLSTPVIPPLSREEDEDDETIDEDEAPERPPAQPPARPVFASRVMTAPAVSSDDEYDEDDEADEEVDEADEDVEEKPARPMFGTAVRSSVSPFSRTPERSRDADDVEPDDDEEEVEEKPARPTFGTGVRSSVSPFSRTPERSRDADDAEPIDADDDEEEVEEKPARPMFGTAVRSSVSPFSRTPERSHDADDAEPLDNDEEEVEEKPARPMFGTGVRSSVSPFSRTPERSQDDDDDEEEVEEKPARPMFGTAVRSSVSPFSRTPERSRDADDVEPDDEEDDEDVEEKPARPMFGSPARSAGSPFFRSSEPKTGTESESESSSTKEVDPTARLRDRLSRSQSVLGGGSSSAGTSGPNGPSDRTNPPSIFDDLRKPSSDHDDDDTPRRPTTGLKPSASSFRSDLGALMGADEDDDDGDVVYEDLDDGYSEYDEDFYDEDDDEVYEDLDDDYP